MTQSKWTDAVYYALYSELVSRFGPKKSWGKKRSPSNTKEFKEWLSEVANNISELTNQPVSAGAVAQQLQFAITKQKKISKRHITPFLANKYWGKRTGFLETQDLPEVECEY